jgi:radical SAM protein with 4Fe4S-binding SPASM domain
VSTLKFKKIYLEITNRCNLACNFCLASQRPKEFMAPSLFAAILKQVKPHTDHLSLHVLGEPLLHPELGEIFDLCHEQALRVNLTTNGTLLSRHLDVLLTKPALRQLNISLHCLESMASDHQQEEYLAGIFSFVRLATVHTKLYISLRLWNSGEQALNTTILARLCSFFDRQTELIDTLTPGQGIALAPRVFLSIANRFAWPHLPGPDQGEQGFCQGLRTHAAILVDGTVVPCCLDAEGDIPLGNIREQSLAVILGSARATRMRDGFKARKIVEPLCRRCSFRRAFDRSSIPAGSP